MTVFEAIRTKALAYGPLAALVGTRIYPMRLPQTPTYPAITYRRAAGDSQSDIGVDSPIFQFDVWASGYSAAETVTAALRSALEREKFISGNIEIVSCTMSRTPLDMYDEAVQKNRVSLDFKVKYREV